MKRRQLITINIVLLCGILVAIAAWWFLVPEGTGGIEPDRSLYPLRGIDVSAHNGAIDFRAVADEGIDFVYIKATEGNTFRDSMASTNYYSARAAGLRTGLYHYFRFDCEPVAQAANLLAVLEAHPTDLPPAIDVESANNNVGVNPEAVRNRVGAMVRILEDAGYMPLIYTNKRGYDRYIANNVDSLRLWICSFTDPPIEGDWVFWQHSHSGRVKGIDGPVDLNTFNGTTLDFARWK